MDWVWIVEEVFFSALTVYLFGELTSTMSPDGMNEDCQMALGLVHSIRWFAGRSNVYIFNRHMLRQNKRHEMLPTYESVWYIVLNRNNHELNIWSMENSKNVNKRDFQTIFSNQFLFLYEFSIWNNNIKSTVMFWRDIDSSAAAFAQMNYFS